MSARKFIAFVLVFAAGLGAGYLVRPSAKTRTDPNWPAEMPNQLMVSYPHENGRKGHILKVNRLSTIHPGTTFDSSAWRLNLTTETGVWFLECDLIGTEYVR
jgi:hypothetical protein